MCCGRSIDRSAADATEDLREIHREDVDLQPVTRLEHRLGRKQTQVDLHRDAGLHRFRAASDSV